MSRSALRWRRTKPPLLDGGPYVAGVSVGGNQPWSTTRAADYQAMSDANVSWIRSDIGWMYVEPTQGNFTFAQTFDPVVSDVTANGMRYLAILHTVPGWANNNAGDYGLPTDLTRLTTYAYRTALHYIPLGVTDYEVGNEMNLPHPGWTPSGTTYATSWLPRIVTGLRQAATELGAQINIVFGGLAPLFGGGGQAPTTFLTQAYAAGAKNLFNHMAWHPYTGADVPATSADFNAGSQNLYNIMVANGDGAKKIWATEYGNPTGGATADDHVSEAEQASRLADGLDRWYAKPFAGPMFVYSHRDRATPTGDRESYFGVRRANGTQKPSYAVLRDRLVQDRVTPPTYAEMILADGPELYLPMGGPNGLVDRTGHGHNASPVNSPTTAAWIDGTQSAMAFNGTSNYVEIPDHPKLSIPYTGKFTYELWMSCAAVEFTKYQGTGNYVHLFGKGDTGRDEYVLRMYPASYDKSPSRISGYTFNLAGGLGTGTYRQRPIVLGQWHHVMVVCDTDLTSRAYPDTAYPGTVRIYFDGVLFDIDPLDNYNTVPGNGTDPLRIGAVSPPDSYWPGRISQVAVYNKLLGPHDAMKRYRAKVPLQVGEGGLSRQIGQAQSSTTGTTLQVAVTGTPLTAGNTTVVGIFGEYTTSAPTMSDAKGGTWALDRGFSLYQNTGRVSYYRRTGGTTLAVGDWIRATWSSALSRKAMVAAELTGLVTPVAIDAIGSYNSNSVTSGWDTEYPEAPTSDTKMTECPFSHITTVSERTILVAVHGIQVPGNVAMSLDDPQAWALAGHIGTTGGALDVDRTVVMEVRSVTESREYTAGVTFAQPGRWGTVAIAYKAVAGTSPDTPFAVTEDVVTADNTAEGLSADDGVLTVDHAAMPSADLSGDVLIVNP